MSTDESDLHGTVNAAVVGVAVCAAIAPAMASQSAR
jgi:hypothetical protein